MAKQIDNKQWSVEVLIEMVNNKEIIKPKFQRKRKWDVKPMKEHVPSEKNFIEFLYETRNSIHPITFGKKDSNVYTNIDGNNRINAICHFMNKPFELFDELLIDINEFIDTKAELGDINEKLKRSFANISYKEMMEFEYEEFLTKELGKEIYEKYMISPGLNFNKIIKNTIKKLKTHDNRDFSSTVKINVNVFENYNENELCRIFENINKYTNRLTVTELLACQLYDKDDFDINNEKFKIDIKEEISEYYLIKSEDECLDCYIYNKDDKLNVFDLMAGLQNYSYRNCKIFEEFKCDKDDGLPFIYKLWRLLYNNLNESFTNENINEFIMIILKVIDLLKQTTDIIYDTRLDNVINNKKSIQLKKNNVYELCAAICGYLKTVPVTPDKIIIKSIERTIIYHLTINELKDKNLKSRLNKMNYLAYKAGGGVIDNEAAKLYKNPEMISNLISEDNIRELFKKLIDESVKGVGAKKNRRLRRAFETILISAYYKTHMSITYLENDIKYSFEHIVPFSSNYKGYKIDIDRLGNIIPIIHELNNQRGARSIAFYNEEYSSFIKLLNIIPDIDTYNQIVEHDKKPKIIDAIKYNQLCDKNERIYIETFISYLFK